MKKIIFVITLLFIPSFALALNSEVSITKDGKVTIKGVKIMQLAGPTLFARMYWGEAFVRITIKTNSSTLFYRATGEKTSLSEFSVDDVLNVEGELEPGGNQLVVLPKVLRNSSVEKEQSVLKGKVVSVDLSKNSFVLNDTNRGQVTVLVGTTTEFIKGSRNIDLFRLKLGDTIAQTSGDYNLKTKTLESRAVVVYVDMNAFKPKIHEGVISSLRNNSLPTDISVKIGNTNYTVFLGTNSSVLNKERKNTTLSRFEIGDKVRLYGSIRESDDALLDAEVVRNTDI